MLRTPYVSDDHTEPPLSQAPCATTQNYDKTAYIFELTLAPPECKSRSQRTKTTKIPNTGLGTETTMHA